MAEMNLNDIFVINLAPGAEKDINLDKGTLWKVESAGLGGTNGTIYLQDEDSQKIAMLYSAVNQSTYASQLPFWIMNFKGKFVNSGSYYGCVSITEYKVV